MPGGYRLNRVGEAIPDDKPASLPMTRVDKLMFTELAPSDRVEENRSHYY